MAKRLVLQGTLDCSGGADTLDLATPVNALDRANRASPGVVIVFANRGSADASILLDGSTLSQVAETIIAGDPPYVWGGEEGMFVPFDTGEYTLSGATGAVIDYSVYRVV